MAEFEKQIKIKNKFLYKELEKEAKGAVPKRTRQDQLEIILLERYEKKK